MDINLGNNFSGNIGVRPDATDVRIGGAEQKSLESPSLFRTERNLTIEKGVGDISSAEPTADVPESELTRDDGLGRLVNAAFCLRAPPMPDFSA